MTLAVKTIDRTLSERLIWAILAHCGRVDGYLDVGTGDAVRVKTAKSIGIRPALGIETSIPIKDASVVPSSILVKDFHKRFDLNDSFELVSCIGKADEVPIEKRDVFTSNLIRHCDKWLVVDDVDWLREVLERQGFNFDSAISGNLLECGLIIMKRISL